MTADIAFLVVVLPFTIYATWTDLRFMKLKNVMNIALAASFVVVGLIYLPIDQVAFRFGVGIGVFVVLIFLSAAGVFGGGDAKYLAALAPWVWPEDYMAFCFMLSCTLLLALVVQRAIGRIAWVRNATPEWTSWTHTKIPMGYGISGAMALYLAMRALTGGVLIG